MTTVDSGSLLSSSTINAATITNTITNTNSTNSNSNPQQTRTPSVINVAPSATIKSTAITIPINSSNKKKKNSECDYNVDDCRQSKSPVMLSLSCHDHQQQQQQMEQQQHPAKFHAPPSQLEDVIFSEMSGKKSTGIDDTHPNDVIGCHHVTPASIPADLPQSSAASFSSCCSSCSLNSVIQVAAAAHVNHHHTVTAEDDVVVQSVTATVTAAATTTDDDHDVGGVTASSSSASSSAHIAALPLITPQKSRTIPADKINLRVILVSGKTKEFLFNPTDSAADIVQTVFLNWPDDWKHEAVSKAEILRLIFQGRFLHCSVTLGALGLPLGKTTVMHLVSRDNLPEPNSPDQGQKGKSGSNRCCSAACCIL